MGNKNCHGYHIVDESPWPFLVSTASLFLTLGAVLFFHFFIQGLDSSFDNCSSMMMLGFFKSKKISMKNILNLNYTIIKRQYSNQAFFDLLVSRKKVATIDSLAQDSMCHQLIDPVTNVNVTLHKSDLMLQQSYKKFGLTLTDLIRDFNLNSFFNSRPNLSLLNNQLRNNSNNSVLYQRTNTIGELSCIEVCRRNLKYLDTIDMTWSKKVNLLSFNFTGNALPDYACSIVYAKGLVHQYHADLKQTNIIAFEKMVNRLHPNQIINTNIYWIDDKNFDGQYVFKGLTKIKLEDTYNQIITTCYSTLSPALAKTMHMSSFSAFNKFKKSGLAQDYNDIPLGTPKFMFISWITKIF